MPHKFFIYNTASKKIEEFKPLKEGEVRMYSCGPTVYDYAHIGHARTYVLTDILRRTLEFLGFKVTQVMNITDVGHLTTDDDLGEDKLLKGLRRERQKRGEDITIWDIIEFYTDDFLKMLRKLNIRQPTHMPRATEHVQDMIEIINTLLKKGYAYKTKQAVYFHVPKFKGYTKLFDQALDEKIVGARKEVNVDPEKKHPADFRLWQLDQPNHILQWDTPWGKGFPGWHIECSAMSMKYLGPTFDIHTGGEDHIFPHHTNEIAQSEAATGKTFANYWVHFYHLLGDGRKMSKSLGNYYRLADLEKMGFLPQEVRYLFLGTHYRKRLNFTTQSLKAAQKAYAKLLEHYQVARSTIWWQEFLNRYTPGGMLKDVWEAANKTVQDTTNRLFPKTKVLTYDDFKAFAQKLGVEEEFTPILEVFTEFVSNDLNVPNAVAKLWEALRRTNISAITKLMVLALFYNVLGVEFVHKTPIEDIADESILASVVEKTLQIKSLKQQKQWDKVDSVKQELLQEYTSGIKVPKPYTGVKLIDVSLPLNITMAIYDREFKS